MAPFKNILLFAVVVTMAGASGFAVQRHMAANDSNNLSNSPDIINGTAPQFRPEFSMIDIEGNTRHIKEWDGKIIMLNFWATWCPPCMNEIPDFIELQQQYGDQGLQIIGIAIDNEEAVREFANEIGMNYPIIASEIDAIELSRRYGNQIGGLPYTAIINRKGEVTNTITGELSKIKAEKILLELGLEV